LGLFVNEINLLCSSLMNVNNKLLLYKIETYPYLTDTKTNQTIAAHPKQYYLTIEPFQILVNNIVAVAKPTSETIHEWHKYALKLKSQYLELHNTRSAKNIHILTIILAISLSAFFLFANDPFNLIRQNSELRNKIMILKNELKSLKSREVKSK